MPATVSLVAFSWLPLTASVLVSLSSPAATLVILFGPVPPWLALKALRLLSHSSASLLRPVIWSPRLVMLPSTLVTRPSMLVTWSPMVVTRLSTLVTASLVAFS
ncbi:hypothetical protein D3C78_1477710 [compost metagenome]